jgi:hypothetical protein
MPIQETLILAVTKMLGGVCIAGMTTEKDPVTHLKWVRPVREHGHVLLGDITTAEGRAWLPKDGGWTEFDAGDLETRLGIQEIYLALGLTRSYKGDCWLIVIGVHTLPDYEAVVDYDNL